jgi:hypothetical protein
MKKKVGIFIDERARQLFEHVSKRINRRSVRVVEIKECVCQHDGDLEKFSFVLAHPPCLDGSICPYSSVEENLSFEKFIDSHPHIPFYVLAVMGRDVYSTLNDKINCHVLYHADQSVFVETPISFHEGHLVKKMNGAS